MEEKKLTTILNALADKIDALELSLYVKNIECKQLKEDNDRLVEDKKILKEENERLNRENDDLRAENERYKRITHVEFKKIERFGENDG